jgi:hypothetical protein
LLNCFTVAVLIKFRVKIVDILHEGVGDRFCNGSIRFFDKVTNCRYFVGDLEDTPQQVDENPNIRGTHRFNEVFLKAIIEIEDGNELL